MTMICGHFNRSCNVVGTNFTNAKLEGTKFGNIVFQDNKLTNTNLSDCIFQSVKFKSNIKFDNADFRNSYMEYLEIENNVYLRKCNLTNTTINNVKSTIWNKLYLFFYLR